MHCEPSFRSILVRGASTAALGLSLAGGCASQHETAPQAHNESTAQPASATIPPAERSSSPDKTPPSGANASSVDQSLQ